MYTKNQFNKLLKTRKHWTGQQVGRMLVQATIQQMSGKTPFVDSEKDLGPLVSRFADPKDISDYNVYAKLSSGFLSAWNYVEAIGNDARASLGILQSFIQNFTDWTNAERNNQARPAVVTQKQYNKYKKKYDAIVANDRKKAGQIKEPIAYVLLHPKYENTGVRQADGTYFTRRELGKRATQIVNEYKNKQFTPEEISFLRNFIQDHLKTYKYDFDDFDHNDADIDIVDENKIATGIFSIEWFVQYPNYPKYTALDRNVSTFLLKHYRPNKRVGIAKTAKHYLDLLYNEQLLILHQQKITYKDALFKAVRKYPYSLQAKELTHPERIPRYHEHDTVPYIPSSLTYADLFRVNPDTADVADAFWNYLSQNHKGKDIDQRFEKFIREHFSDFFEASKKDLIEAHPKLDKFFNKVTNSTSLIIPLIPWKALADAGLEEYQNLVEESGTDSVRKIADVFPQRIREQARHNGIAILVPGSRQTLPGMHDDSDEEAVARGQHYELKPFINAQLTSSANKKLITKAIKSINYYVVVQTTYADYIKGVARFTRNTGLNRYNQTPAFNKFKQSIQQYNDSLLRLIQLLSWALDNTDDQLKINSVITQAFPMISLSCDGYKHKPVNELAKIIEESYTKYDAIDVFAIINAIAEGAPDYE